ncbi:hypothetical protein ACX0G7_26810 [Flavitalea antarctica]
MMTGDLAYPPNDLSVYVRQANAHTRQFIIPVAFAALDPSVTAFM